MIFVLEDIHDFGGLGDQSLLYTVFEASISKLPILVLGTTSRYDIVSTFEKRVKSRFSQHCILIKPPESFDQWMKLLEKALSIEDISYTAYNKSVHDTLKQKTIQKLLKDQFAVSSAIHPILLRLADVIPADPKSFKLTSRNLLAALDEDGEIEENLAYFSLPMLIIIVCIHRIRLKTMENPKGGNSILSFESVWKEYGEVKVVAGQSVAGQMSLSFSRELLLMAWTSLMNAGFLKPICMESGPDPSLSRVNLQIPLGDIVGKLTASDCPSYLVQLASLM